MVLILMTRWPKPRTNYSAIQILLEALSIGALELSISEVVVQKLSNKKLFFPHPFFPLVAKISPCLNVVFISEKFAK
jgi:hypothetical protein